MARFKHYDYRQTKMLPVRFEEQILPGTFERTLNGLIDASIDLTVFEARYEPVFANLRSTHRLDRFSHRGRRKVTTQWQLYCLVHNIGKVQRYAQLETTRANTT